MKHRGGAERSTKIIATSMAVVMAVSSVGCAGRGASPIIPIRGGDRNLACRAIEAEKLSMQGVIQDLEEEKSGVTPYNVAVGVVGLVTLFPLFGLPWLALDLKTGDAVSRETRALRKRDNHLTLLASRKKCEIASLSY